MKTLKAYRESGYQLKKRITRIEPFALTTLDGYDSRNWMEAKNGGGE